MAKSRTVAGDQKTPDPGRDFFTGLDRPIPTRQDTFDIYSPAPTEPRPAVVFIHGGPVPEGQVPTPRNSDIFTGYGALAVSAGLVGATFDHQLYTMEHYPLSAADVSTAVGQIRESDQVDPDRIALWFFSGGGALAADWLRTPPNWLRGVVWTYPVLRPPTDWPGDGPRFDCTRAVNNAREIPKLLIRVGEEYPEFSQTQHALINAAHASNSTLDVINIPEVAHGYETLGYNKQARNATDQAMSWVAGHVK